MLVAGSHLPCLVYMTSGENLDEHQKHWQKFSAAPTGKQLPAGPQYQDTMTVMIQVLLKRASASRI